MAGLIIVAIVAGVVIFGGSNTVDGFGQDAEVTGDKIERSLDNNGY